MLRLEVTADDQNKSREIPAMHYTKTPSRLKPCRKPIMGSHSQVAFFVVLIHSSLSSLQPTQPRKANRLASHCSLSELTALELAPQNTKTVPRDSWTESWYKHSRDAINFLPKTDF